MGYFKACLLLGTLAVGEWLSRFADEENRRPRHPSFKVTEDAAADQDSARKTLLF